MYWFKFKGLLYIACSGFIIMNFLACRPDIKEANNSLKYFDIKGYFTADTTRLKKLNRQVLKTVTHNGVSETKTVKINNWGQELDLFIGADINKPAWKDSYTIVNGDDISLYKAKEEDLKVREIIIKKEGTTIKWILIFTRSQNILYRTTEKLSYYPDSLYLIEKDQHVKLMKNNHYKILGIIK